MRRFGSVGQVCSVIVLLAAGTPPSCSGPSACPAVGYISTVTLHITPQRAATLAKLDIEMCQDGTCHSLSIDATAPLTPGPVPLPTPPGAPGAVPVRAADGSIDVRIEISINDDPLDLTTSGTNTSGWSIGTSHTMLNPATTYPNGRGCGGPTTAVATLDGRGLRAG